MGSVGNVATMHVRVRIKDAVFGYKQKGKCKRNVESHTERRNVNPGAKLRTRSNCLRATSLVAQTNGSDLRTYTTWSIQLFTSSTEQ